MSEAKRLHLLSLLAEREPHATWLGDPIGLYPADLIAIEEAVHRVSPDRLLLVNVEAGVVRFVDAVLTAMGKEAVLVWIAAQAASLQMMNSKLVALAADPSRPAVIEEALHLGMGSEQVAVMIGLDRREVFAPQVIARYARFVSPRSYLILLRTLFSRPWVGYAQFDHAGLLYVLKEPDLGFTVDTSWETRHVLTACPSGFLLRTAGGRPVSDLSQSFQAVP